MIAVNLLHGRVAAEMRLRRTVLRIVRIGYLLVIVSCCAMVAIMLRRSAAIQMQREQTRVASADLVRNVTRYSVEDLAKDWAGYGHQLEAITRRMNERTSWSVRLGAVRRLIPAEAYVQKLSFETNATGVGGVVRATILVHPQQKRALDIVNAFMKAVAGDAQLGCTLVMDSQQRSIINGKDVEIFNLSGVFQ